MYNKKRISILLIIVLTLCMNSMAFANESCVKEKQSEDLLFQIEDREILAELRPTMLRSATYEVTSNNVRLRSNPSLSSTVLGHLMKGDMVNTGEYETVTADGYEWLNVYSYNHGVWGWVAIKYLDQIG
ncbi:SH3 domain-containing protein [Anaerophilus nitritogenes]|uniref:SH3 domain-containing protein n=1 Tax=Anaerophilus nitritogenes TaxID=2498136 RepID=UPI00101C7345|nr:SH3 domain-containing protein [Anaerophilus nitritogenes]